MLTATPPSRAASRPGERTAGDRKAGAGTAGGRGATGRRLRAGGRGRGSHGGRRGGGPELLCVSPCASRQGWVGMLLPARVPAARAFAQPNRPRSGPVRGRSATDERASGAVRFRPRKKDAARVPARLLCASGARAVICNVVFARVRLCVLQSQPPACRAGRSAF